MSLFHSYPVLVPITVGLLTEIAKLAVVILKKGVLTKKDIFQTGGMPSGHTALVSSLVTTVGIIEGVDTTSFSIAVAFAAIIMYDAVKLRRAAGRHAEEINTLIGQDKLNIRLGHRPIEVLIGMIVGIVFAFLLLM